MPAPVMTAAGNSLQTSTAGRTEALEPHRKPVSNPHDQLLKMNRQRPKNAVALSGRPHQRPTARKSEAVIAAQTLSKARLEVGPTVAVCLLLLDELSS